MLTGNGTIGALVPGDPKKEHIILSHEKLFMPEYLPHKAPPLYKYLDEVKERVLKGNGGKASDLMIEAGKEVGINDMIWTDPLVPACQLQIESLSKRKVTDYNRSVNYETGEASVVWKEGETTYDRTIFFSRPDSVGVMKISGSTTGSLNFKFRLKRLYPDDEIVFLPTLPQEWPDGKIKGANTRCGVHVDFEWNGGKPVSAMLQAQRNTRFEVIYKGKKETMELAKGETKEYSFKR